MNRSPIFRPQIGNQRDAITERIARNSNADEGRHYMIQDLFSGSQPGVWKLMAGHQKDAAVKNLKILNAPSGRKQPKNK